MAKNVEVGDTSLENVDVPDLQKPRKPSSAYFYFVKKHRVRLQQQHPTWPMKRIISSVASMWSKTSQESRASFIELAEKDTTRYKNQVGNTNEKVMYFLIKKPNRCNIWNGCLREDLKVFPSISYLVSPFDFLWKTDRFWADLKIFLQVFFAKSLKKTVFYVYEKLQRNPSVGSCIKILIFRPYEFDYLGFLTNARRGAMRSNTQWVFYRDLDWWPGPQKVQFGEIPG